MSEKDMLVNKPNFTAIKAKEHNKKLFKLKEQEFLEMAKKYIPNPNWNTDKVINDFTYENFASIFYYIQEIKKIGNVHT